NAATGRLDTVKKSTYANLVLLDDNGEGLLTYRWSMGLWYGDPGVFLNAYEANKEYVYASGDYRAAYSSEKAPGQGGPATELTRQLVYIRRDYIVVYDRAATLKAEYPKILQWHTRGGEAAIKDNSFVLSAGSSKLFGQTFSTLALKTTGDFVL